MEWPKEVKSFRNDLLRAFGGAVIDLACGVGMVEISKPSGLEAAIVVGGAGVGALLLVPAGVRLARHDYQPNSFEVVESYLEPYP